MKSLLLYGCALRKSWQINMISDLEEMENGQRKIEILFKVILKPMFIINMILSYNVS
jgi:hypothetical protein